MSERLFDATYAGRRVLVTGSSGFLGGWTTRWLVQLGARVAGYSRGSGANDVAPVAGVAEYHGDIADQARVTEVIGRFDPEIIVHLAGSATVAAGFRSPLATFEANVTGTSAVLHAALGNPSTRAVVVAGTPSHVVLDDALELNPYPASKLAVEAVVGAYAHARTQELAGRDEPMGIGVARPGVMIGGDWAEGRLLADVVRNVRTGQPVVLNAPAAVRPWQHVLEGVGGVLALGAALTAGTAPLRRYDFGRLDTAGTETVGEVVTRFLAAFGVPYWPVHTTGTGGDRIVLGAENARADLGWTPVWNLEQALAASAMWYHADGPAQVGAVMDEVIAEYGSAAAAAWRQVPSAVD